MRILLLDDDTDVNATLSSVLTLSGHDVVSVERVCDARQAWIEGPAFDVAVLDVNLRDENSITLMRDMKRETPALRVVVITGGGTVEPGVGLALAAAHGVDAALFKPFTNNEFIAAVTGKRARDA
ncbi:MAG: response regulator [Pseudomonadota bacterium]